MIFTEEQEAKLRKISEYFDLENRFVKLKEENKELLDAINNIMWSNVEEESIDNLVVILTLYIKYIEELGLNHLTEILDFKLGRTIERMEAGYYD